MGEENKGENVHCPAVVMAMDQERKVLAAASGRTFAVWEVASGRVLCRRELSAGLKPEPVIRCVALGTDAATGHVLCATAGDDKILRVWDVAACADASVAGSCIATPKRLTDVAFDRAGCVVYADKFGDVYRVPLPLPTALTAALLAPPAPAAAAEQAAARKSKGREPAPRAAATPEDACILGHCSMLTALALAPDETLVATGDRDEHVRVSRYPAAYDIVAYCLGHTASVFGAVFCGSAKRLCTGAGDGTLRVWCTSSGAELACVRPKGKDENKEEDKGKGDEPIVVACDWCEGRETVAARVEGEACVRLYRVEGATGALVPAQTLATPSAALAVRFDAAGRVLVATAHHGIRVFAADGSEEAAFDDSALGTCSAADADAIVAGSACSLSLRVVYPRDGERPAKRAYAGAANENSKNTSQEQD